MLPTHYDQYEPLNKQASNFLGRLHQRRVAALVLLLLGLLGGFQLYRINSQTTISANNLDSLHDTATTSLGNGLGWSGGDSKTINIDATPATFESSSSTTTTSSQAPLITTTPPTTAAAKVVDSLNATNALSTGTYDIDEAEWHMPSDVVLAANDPLYRSRLRPYFRQELEDIHREKGFGTAVDLREAPFIRRSLYLHLLQSFHKFAEAYDFHFWLAHGTLLGQRW